MDGNSSVTTISLVRHGRVENPEAVYYGRLPGFVLAEEGREQAEATGRFLAQDAVSAIYHSPMLRAAQTARIVRDQLAEPVPLVECALLNEIYSPYDGLSLAEMERRNWDFYHELPRPYEQPEEVLARVLAFFERLRREHPGRHVVGVSHGDPIAFAILWAFDRPASTMQKRLLVECGVDDLYPAPASISTFRFSDTGALLDYRYHCPHAIV